MARCGERDPMETMRGSAADTELQSRKRKSTEEAAMLDDDLHHHLLEEEEDPEEENEVMEEGVNPVELLEGLKHADGSIYKKIGFFSWLYRLQSCEETSMQPMRLTLPTTECQQPTCGRHAGSPMLQIFSTKLTKLPRAAAAAAGGGGPIQLYGFMAVWDLKDPLRNYVFNRSRDDPLVIPDLRSDPFVYLSGPRRGVHMRARVLFEFDVRIKREYEDDLQLIDGVAVFSELSCIHEPATCRIRGDRGGAMDVRRALLLKAVEATVQVWIQELPLQLLGGDVGGAGLDLSISASDPTMAADEIRLFRGIIQKPCALDRFVVAVTVTSSLILHFRVAGSDRPIGEFAFRSTAHGSSSDRRKFDFATVVVQVTWSPMH